MGIPYYFAYLVKTYPEIMSEYRAIHEKVDILYIDANSVIYDAIHAMKLDVAAGYEVYYDDIINATIARLRIIIKRVCVSKVFIAFDGVAPRAKMEQQRQRRARMGLTGLIFITPGTIFMEKLTNCVHKELSEYIITGADIPGEGEHKIFSDIRSRSEILKDQCVYVYGLDADLIILGLAHCQLYIPKLKLIRERNQMTTDAHITTTKDDDALFTMDMAYFISILTNKEVLNIPDYIFMSFFLGNDFMPHFPSLNIRTNGIDNLFRTYRSLIKMCGQGGVFCSQNWDIQWSNVRKFIQLLAQKEGDWFYCEHVLRDKMEQRIQSQGVFKEDDLPILYRETEKYIAPQYPNWEARYYMALFKEENVGRMDICINWLEGLEWCMRYYYGIGGDVPSWTWVYKYNYPPLFIDLVNATPNTTFFNKDDIHVPCSPSEQLAYVMPIANNKVELEWAYCRYTWEGHVC